MSRGTTCCWPVASASRRCSAWRSGWRSAARPCRCSTPRATNRNFAYADVLRSALGDRLRTFDASAGEQIDIDATIAALPPRALLLTCGPLGLLEARAQRLGRALAARPPTCASRTFGKQRGPAQHRHFRVRVPRHGIDVEVPADRSLLDVLQAAGVETLADCLRGECGLCAMDVLSVEGAIDHRDVFFSEHQKRANDRLCACVSRVLRPCGS